MQKTAEIWWNTKRCKITDDDNNYIDDDDAKKKLKLKMQLSV